MPKTEHFIVWILDIAVTIGAYAIGEMGIAMFFGFFAVSGAFLMFFTVFFGWNPFEKSP